MLKTTLRRIWPALMLGALPCILLWPIFVGRVLLPAHLLGDVMPWNALHGGSPAPWNPLQFDGIAQFYPWRKFAAQTLLRGYLPLWNPNEFCGTPFLANGQSAVLYPPNVLFAAMPPMYAFGVSALLHLIATGLFMYYFLRRELGLLRGAAALGAAAWQLSTWQVSWLALPSFLDTSAWFPCALVMVHRLSVRPNTMRAAGLGTCAGLMLLAGHLQIAIYGLLLIAAYGVLLTAATRTPLKRSAALAGLAIAVALGLAAPQILPTLELSRMSARSASHASRADYRAYIALAMPAYQLATLYMPRLFGVPGDRGAPVARPTDPPGETVYHGETGYFGKTNFAETASYVGVVTLLLAIIGVLGVRKPDKHTYFFAAGALLALLVALGTPVAGVFYFGIPGFSQTGSPARILVLWALSLSVLAASGCDAVLRRSARCLWPSIVFVGAGIGLTAYTQLALAGLLGKTASILEGAANDIRVALALSLAGIAVIAGHECKRIATAQAAAILIGLVVIDLTATGVGYNPAANPAEVYPRTPLVSWLIAHNHQARIMPENRGWAIAAAPAAELPPNSGTVYGLPEAQGYDSLQTGQFKSFLKQLDQGADPSPGANGNIDFTWGPPGKESRFAALRYLVFPAGAPLPCPPAYSGADGAVCIDPQARPRVDTPAGAIPTFSEPAPTRMTISTIDGGEITVADQWYPGWVARQGGRTLPVLRGPYVFRTIPDVQPGRVSLQYSPASFLTGLYAACVTIGVLAALAMFALVTSVRVATGAPKPAEWLPRASYTQE